MLQYVAYPCCGGVFLRQVRVNGPFCYNVEHGNFMKKVCSQRATRMCHAAVLDALLLYCAVRLMMQWHVTAISCPISVQGMTYRWSKGEFNHCTALRCNRICFFVFCFLVLVLSSPFSGKNEWLGDHRHERSEIGNRVSNVQQDASRALQFLTLSNFFHHK